MNLSGKLYVNYNLRCQNIFSLCSSNSSFTWWKQTNTKIWKKFLKNRETKLHAIHVFRQDHLRSDLGIISGLGSFAVGDLAALYRPLFQYVIGISRILQQIYLSIIRDFSRLHSTFAWLYYHCLKLRVIYTFYSCNTAVSNRCHTFKTCLQSKAVFVFGSKLSSPCVSFQRKEKPPTLWRCLLWYFENKQKSFGSRYIQYRGATSQKIRFVKLWDLVPFSSKASLEKGPCQKLPLNCNSQPKYKGWKFDTAPYKSL